MRRILIALLPAATLSLAAAPALADMYTPNGGTYPSGGGVTTPMTTFTPAPSIYDSPFAVFEAPVAALEGGYATAQQPHCGVIRRSGGGYTAVCGL